MTDNDVTAVLSSPLSVLDERLQLTCIYYQMLMISSRIHHFSLRPTRFVNPDRLLNVTQP